MNVARSICDVGVLYVSIMRFAQNAQGALTQYSEKLAERRALSGYENKF